VSARRGSIERYCSLLRIEASDSSLKSAKPSDLESADGRADPGGDVGLTLPRVAPIYGRGAGVGRGRAIGVARGVVEGVAVGVGDGPASNSISILSIPSIQVPRLG